MPTKYAVLDPDSAAAPWKDRLLALEQEANRLEAYAFAPLPGEPDTSARQKELAEQIKGIQKVLADLEKSSD